MTWSLTCEDERDSVSFGGGDKKNLISRNLFVLDLLVSDKRQETGLRHPRLLLADDDSN